MVPSRRQGCRVEVERSGQLCDACGLRGKTRDRGKAGSGVGGEQPASEESSQTIVTFAEGWHTVLGEEELGISFLVLVLSEASGEEAWGG